MSRENVEVARQLLEAVSARDLSRVLELIDPDVEWHSFFALQGEAYHGHGGVHHYVIDIHEAFEDLAPS